ncbi:hypothetical protein GCM10027445_06470 [Amycolatopsis endophytica]
MRDIQPREGKCGWPAPSPGHPHASRRGRRFPGARRTPSPSEFPGTHDVMSQDCRFRERLGSVKTPK